MSLFNQNFSNHADSQVEEDRIALEQSHRTCDEYDVSWLSSQKVVSDWNHKGLSFWFM